MNQTLVRWTSGLTLAAAVWLVLSPIWVNYANSGMVWMQVIVGIIVGILALVKMASPQSTAPSGLNFLAGIWFIVAPWVIASTTGAKWNQVILGIIVAVLAATELADASMADDTDQAALSSRDQSMAFGERLGDRDDR